MTIEQIEIERIKRMVRVLSLPRPAKYSSRQRKKDREIIESLTLKLAEMDLIQEK